MTDINEKFYKITETEHDFDALIDKIKDMLKSEKENGNIKDYKCFVDTDVYDSCGLDIYYLAISWIDNNNQLHMTGTSHWQH